MIRLHPIFRPYMKPDDDKGGGGNVDRGDDWTPTDPVAKADPKPEPKAEPKTDPVVDPATDPEKGDKDDKGDKGDKDDKKEPKKDTRLPLARHQEILAKERERREQLEREVAQLRQGQAVAKTNEDITKAEEAVAGMEKEYLDLLAKGEVEKAAAKMAEIRRTERSISQSTMLMETQAAEARAYERVKYDNTVERLEAAYPVINPDHADYDKEKTADVIELRDGYLATGKYSRAEALQKACKTLLKASTAKQENATEVDVRVDKEDVAKAVREERKKDAVAKNLDTATKQPPSAAGVGQDSDKNGGKLKAADVIKMPQKEFAKLAESDLADLRGDTL